MNDNQKLKSKFRNSKTWKQFRHKINVKQNGKDYITGAKLRKYANLHHCDLNVEHYDDISNEEHFVYLNNGCHDAVHYLWTYYKKDETVIDRLVEILNRMKEINNG